MKKYYQKIKEEQESDIILLQRLQEEQDKFISEVRCDELEARMRTLQGRIDGLNIALKILNNI